MRIVSKTALVTSVFEDFLDNEVLVSYFGVLNFELSNQLVKVVKASLGELKISKSSLTKIYTVFTEGLENAYKHQKQMDEGSFGIVLLSKRGNTFHFSVGNIIHAKERFVIKDLIDQVNLKNSIELDELTEERLVTAEINKDASVKIGLLKMAKFSESKLAYHFRELNNGEIFFLKSITINA